jgi:hypothetical protein
VTLLFVKISRQVGMEMQYNALQEGQDWNKTDLWFYG